jgi:hypothetical protein
MAITPDTIKAAFTELGLTFEQDGDDYVHTTAGNHAPVLHSVATLDEDGNGVTLLTALVDTVPAERRAAVFELLNLVHGQSLWNVRFHLDENGRVFSVGKHMLWGRPFNSVQFGDIFFSLLVSTDRLYPCLHAIATEGKTPVEAFGMFFSTPVEV